jgi:hypothetical protein
MWRVTITDVPLQPFTLGRALAVVVAAADAKSPGVHAPGICPPVRERLALPATFAVWQREIPPFGETNRAAEVGWRDRQRPHRCTGIKNAAKAKINQPIVGALDGVLLKLPRSGHRAGAGSILISPMT